MMSERIKCRKPCEAGESRSSWSGRHLRSELGSGGRERLPFEKTSWRRPSCIQNLRLLESAEPLDLETDRGEKNRRKCNCRGRMKCLQLVTRSTKLVKWPRTLCHMRGGTDGIAVSSWKSDCRATTLCTTGRAINLGISREAPR